MKETEFIKLNFKFQISNFCTNVKVKITSLRTTVRQLANTLTVREFSKWISIFVYIVRGDQEGLFKLVTLDRILNRITRVS
jgi:hypothetical protein